MKEVVVLNNKPFSVDSLFGKEVIGGYLKVTKIIVDYVDVKKGELIYTPDGKIKQAIDDGVAVKAVLDISPKMFITHLSFRVKDIDDRPLNAYIDCWFDKKHKVLRCRIRNSDDYFNNDIIGIVVDFSDLTVDKDNSLNAIESRYGGPTIVENSRMESELLDQMIVCQSRRKDQSTTSSFTLDSLANPETVKKLDLHHIINSKKTGVKLSKLLLLMNLMNHNRK